MPRERRTFRLPVLLAALAAALLSWTAVAAGPASAGVDPGRQWVKDSINAQLHRHPGGVVSGDSIVYAAEGVTLTYKPPTTPGSAVAYDYMGCSTGDICLYTTPNVETAGIRLSTSSLWCPREGHPYLLDLGNYGLSDKIQAADGENNYWSVGIWSNYGLRGPQWEMHPQGILTHLSPTHITYLNVCINSADLDFQL